MTSVQTQPIEGVTTPSPVSPSAAIECVDLCRVYRGKGGETVALDALSLSVEAGSVFGLLGPNGAGKTTTVRILSTLLAPSGGSAAVLGYDVERDTAEVRRHIGLAIGGDRGFYNRLTGRQNLHYFAALAGLAPSEARRRCGDLLDLVRLGDRADEKVERYSRGMKQRLHLARALIARPRVLFLDEPTLGLDPAIAQEFRALVPQLASEGVTVLLTTHYMLEADQLCDELAVIDRGRLVASGTPSAVKARFGDASVVELTVRSAAPDLLDRARALPGVEFAETGADGVFTRLRVFAGEGGDVRDAVLDLCGRDNVEGITTRSRTLEEAYLALLRVPASR